MGVGFSIFQLVITVVIVIAVVGGIAVMVKNKNSQDNSPDKWD